MNIDGFSGMGNRVGLPWASLGLVSAALGARKIQKPKTKHLPTKADEERCFQGWEIHQMITYVFLLGSIWQMNYDEQCFQGWQIGLAAGQPLLPRAKTQRFYSVFCHARSRPP